MTKILVFGDSITWGAFDLEKGGWVERLKKMYLKKSSKTISSEDFYLYNFGMESDTSEGLLYRFEKQIDICEKIESNKKYVLLFEIGANDASVYKDKIFISKDSFKKNIKLLINSARKVTDKIFFIGLTKIDELKTNPIFFDKELCYHNLNLNKYNNLLEKICKEEGIRFISLWDLLDKNDLHDGLHPNSEGHKKIFERVKDFLEKEKIC